MSLYLLSFWNDTVKCHGIGGIGMGRPCRSSTARRIQKEILIINKNCINAQRNRKQAELYMPESTPVKSDFWVLVKEFQARHVCAMGPLAGKPMTLEITLGVSSTLMARPREECHEKRQCRGLGQRSVLLTTQILRSKTREDGPNTRVISVPLYDKVAWAIIGTGRHDHHVASLRVLRTDGGVYVGCAEAAVEDLHVVTV